MLQQCSFGQSWQYCACILTHSLTYRNNPLYVKVYWHQGCNSLILVCTDDILMWILEQSAVVRVIINLGMLWFAQYHEGVGVPYFWYRLWVFNHYKWISSKNVYLIRWVTSVEIGTKSLVADSWCSCSSWQVIAEISLLVLSSCIAWQVIAAKFLLLPGSCFIAASQYWDLLRGSK